jgi:hypothetical protein
MKVTEGRKVTIAGGNVRYLEPGMYVRTAVHDLPGLYRVAAINRTSARLITLEPAPPRPGIARPVPFRQITRVQEGLS